MKKESRRQFLKGTLGMLGGAMTAQATRFFPELQAALAQTGNPSVPPAQLPEQLEVGELYGGFLLLPDDTPVPSFVQYPVSGPPVFCGVGDNPTPSVRMQSFPTVNDVANRVNFSAYTIDSVLNNMKQIGCWLISQPTDDVYCTTVWFGNKNITDKDLECSISIWTYPEFPRPYPLWYDSHIDNDVHTELEKVEFLPTPGIRVTTRTGFVFYWIENNILNNLIVESTLDVDEAQKIVDSLRKIA